MQTIYKIKLPGKPVRTYLGAALKKEQPSIYEAAREVRAGQKKAVKLRIRKRTVTIGVHNLHPSELSEKARRKVCGEGLRGEARRLFIEEGLTLQEQSERARLQTEMEIGRVIEEYRRDHPEQYEARERRQQLRKEARKEERAERKQAKAPKLDLSNLVTPGQMAEQSGLSPLEVRKFLRLKNIGKRGGRYAFKKSEADRIIAAARKHYKEEK